MRRVNSAIEPAPNLMPDNYDWTQRRRLILEKVGACSHDLIFIGDSITHGFEREERGLQAWKRFYANRSVLNLGYGWDCTQNVLWRLENGEFAGQRPKLVVLNIGTNNLTGNSACRPNTAAEIVEAIETICDWLQRRAPTAAILVMAVFPRGLRHEFIWAKVRKLNRRLKTWLTDRPDLLHLDIGEQFLGSDGEIAIELMNDRCHPEASGYAKWAEALEPIVKRYLEMHPSNF
jgi:lysophospholipase L1-like esterase